LRVHRKAREVVGLYRRGFSIGGRFNFIGDAFALATRVEAVTPPDEIYLTAAARLALSSVEIQTALVESRQDRGAPAGGPGR
jgi:class 3 adenylate cyclase